MSYTLDAQPQDDNLSNLTHSSSRFAQSPQPFSQKMQHQLRQVLQRTCQQVGVGDAAGFPVGEQWMAQVAPSGEYWVKDKAGETVCRGNLHTAEVSVPLSTARAKELEQMLSQQHQLGSRTQTAERYQPMVSLEA